MRKLVRILPSKMEKYGHRYGLDKADYAKIMSNPVTFVDNKPSGSDRWYAEDIWGIRFWPVFREEHFVDLTTETYINL